MDHAELSPPADFEPYDRGSPLLAPWSPIYARTAGGRFALGLFIRPAHMNSREIAHGGLIAALADTAMGIACGIKMRAEKINAASLVTTSLTVDYLGAVRAGQWLTFTPTFMHVGRTLCQAEADVAADWVTAARGRASFRVIGRPQPSSSSSS